MMQPIMVIEQTVFMARTMNGHAAEIKREKGARHGVIDVQRPGVHGVATSDWIPAMNAGMTLGVWLYPTQSSVVTPAFIAGVQTVLAKIANFG